MGIDRRQAFHDILAGEQPLGHPYFLTSAWGHFVGSEYGPAEQAKAHIDFVRTWNWDWVKINPRSSYYAEAWGTVFDQYDYGTAGRSPYLVRPAIRGVEDLPRIGYVDPQASRPLAEQIESARLVRQAFPDRAVLQTIFSPLTVLLLLASLPRVRGRRIYGVEPGLTAHELLHGDPEAAKAALQSIALTLADYARWLVAPIEQGGAGVDGVFYAVTGTAASGYFTRDEYREFAEPYDRIVLEGAGDHVKLFHTCQDHANPEWFLNYDIDALQWDHFLAGNPSLEEVRASGRLGAITPVQGPATQLLAIGMSEELLRKQIDDIVRENDGHPFLFGPSCSLPTTLDVSRLRLLREASVYENLAVID